MSEGIDVQASIKELEGKFDRVTLGILAVIGLTAIAPIFDAWRFRAASYEALNQRVSEQNQEIKNLTGEIEDLNTVLGVKKTTEITIPESVNVKKSFKLDQE